jgi:hypothetical protein
LGGIGCGTIGELQWESHGLPRVYLQDQTGLGTVIVSMSNSFQEPIFQEITYSFLLCKISRGSENDNHGVILQLNVSGGAKID